MHICIHVSTHKEHACSMQTCSHMHCYKSYRYIPMITGTHRYKSTHTPASGRVRQSFAANFTSSPAPSPGEGLQAGRTREHSLKGRISEPVSTNYKPWNRLIHHPGVTGWLCSSPSSLPAPSPSPLHFSLSDRRLAPRNRRQHFSRVFRSSPKS